MKLVDNSRRVALRSWSLWCNRIAILVVMGAELRYYLFGIDSDPRVVMLLWLAAALGVEVARYIRQNSISGTTRSPASVAMIAAVLMMGQWWTPEPATPVAPAPSSYTQADFLNVAVPLIGEWEGLRLEAYQDIVGVWTVCYGETSGVRPGDRYTAEQCRDMLASRVVEFQRGWHGYLTPETRVGRLTAERDAAFTSLAYNVGIAGAGKSTATRRLNAGDIPGACDAITWWNKAGDRVVRGLVRRRAAEYDLCMAGVA